MIITINELIGMNDYGIQSLIGTKPLKSINNASEWEDVPCDVRAQSFGIR
jgi:hypothetical protein